MQPLALYVHCGPHFVNLVAQYSLIADMSNALEWLQKLSCLCKLLGKYKTKFVNIASTGSGAVTNLQPHVSNRMDGQDSSYATSVQIYVTW